MWANALVESLSWQSKESDEAGGHVCRMNPAWYAPSWSWASVDGPISYVHVLSPGQTNDPSIYELEVRKLNAASGVITMAGQIITVQLRCRIETKATEEDAGKDPKPPKKLEYYYELPGLSRTGEAFPVKADVPLKAWSGAMSGQQVTTVIRVPHGEAIPQSTWSANCLCLLIAKTRLRCTVLFLGGSLREAGAWERIGMVDGLEPTVFGSAPKQLVNIV